tara:strand:- start:2047 stop:2256 length:210 start_codon:yes stop_codon:yes gene_type:complete
MKLSGTKLISLHIPTALLERVERLRDVADESGEAQTSRASILRRTIAIGVKSMERKIQRQESHDEGVTA